MKTHYTKSELQNIYRMISKRCEIGAYAVEWIPENKKARFEELCEKTDQKVYEEFANYQGMRLVSEHIFVKWFSGKIERDKRIRKGKNS